MPACPHCRSFSLSQTLCDHCGLALVEFADGSTGHVARVETSISEINRLLQSRQYGKAMERCLQTQSYMLESLSESEHPRVVKARHNLETAIERLQALGIRPTRIVASGNVKIEDQAPQMLAGLAFFAAGTGAFMAGLGCLLVFISGRVLMGLLMLLVGVLLGVLGYFQRQWTGWAWHGYLWVNIAFAVGGLIYSGVSVMQPEGPTLEALSGLVVSLASGLIAWYVGTHLDGIRQHSRST